jgi:SAM-dependent methyltransferase
VPVLWYCAHFEELRVASSLYAKIVGLPFVYEHLRPWLVGGIDMTPSFRNLEAGAGDVILDVGCGTGDALNYIENFRAYHGYDTDPIAIAYARKRAQKRGLTVELEARAVDAADIARISPTRVILSGLLHHLPDAEAVSLLRTIGHHPSVARIATQDVVFAPGRLLNNILASLDRGQFVRCVAAYRTLVAEAGLRIVNEELRPCKPGSGRMDFLFLALERQPS